MGVRAVSSSSITWRNKHNSQIMNTLMFFYRKISENNRSRQKSLTWTWGNEFNFRKINPAFLQELYLLETLNNDPSFLVLHVLSICTIKFKWLVSSLYKKGLRRGCVYSNTCSISNSKVVVNNKLGFLM